jgi:SAM-dependent methyltransferase
LKAKDADYVVKMVKNLEDSKDVAPEEYLSLIGEEWSDKSSFQQVMEDFFWPNISETSLVAELGSGGGRVATRVVTRVGELHCYDISKEMLKKAEVAVHASLKLSGQDKPTKFVFLQEPAFPTDLANTFDFVYAFDVFPHVDLHTQWKYYQEFLRVLKPGCKAIIHTANLEAPEGWQRFSQQDKYSVGGFYFMVPSMVLTLVSKAGLTVLKTSDQVKAEKGADRASNTYYNRDFMVLVQKPL